MAQKLTAALPPDLDLTATFQIALAALDPTTGTAVNGVVVSNVAILATSETPDSAVDTTPVPSPLPLFVPIPPDEVAA